MSLFVFLRKSVPIKDVVAGYVRLKPIGHYLKGPCPFHQEKDASFTISPEKQIFYCFGCHETGDVTAFIAKAEGISQIEAARLLIDRHHLTVPEGLLTHEIRQVSGQERAAQQGYVHACQVLTEMMHQELLRNAAACSYLEKRGLTRETIKSYRLGYLPVGAHRLAAFLKDANKEGVLLKDLVTYGIFGENEQHMLYSPFEDRIVFPIYDHFGVTIGFGGRVFKPDDARPKYYNSRESAWFMKGKLLFGFSQAKKKMQEQGSAFLVEGYMDCLAMVQHGYHHTVATLGTACTEEHLALLARHITTLYVLYDGDRAGTKATLRIAELCWQVNLDFKVVILPTGEDPASLLGEQKSCNPYIEQAQDIFTFFINTVVDNFHTKSLSEKLAAGKRIVELISTLHDPFKKELLLNQVASAMKIPLQIVKNMLHEPATNARKSINATTDRLISCDPKIAQPASSGSTKKTFFEQLEKRIVSATLSSPDENYYRELPSELRLCLSENAQQVLLAIEQVALSNRGSLSFFEEVLERLGDEQRGWVMRISIEFGEEQQTRETFRHLLACFYKQQWTRLVQEMRNQVVLAEREGNREKAQALLKQFANFKQGIEQKGFI